MRNEYSIQFLCSLMGVTRSGYYKWRKRQGKINQYGQKRQQLVSLLKAQHNRFPSYGYHRLAAVIVMKQICCLAITLYISAAGNAASVPKYTTTNTKKQDGKILSTLIR